MVILLLVSFVPSCDQVDLKGFLILVYANLSVGNCQPSRPVLRCIALFTDVGYKFLKIFLSLFCGGGFVFVPGWAVLFSFSFAFVNWTTQHQHCS